MTTAVAVIEAGKLSFEPSEVTYRSIMYYLDENMMKMAQRLAPSVVTSTQPQGQPPQYRQTTLRARVLTTRWPAVVPKTTNGNSNSSSSQKVSPHCPTRCLVSDKLSGGGICGNGGGSTNSNAQPIVKLTQNHHPRLRVQF